LECGDPSPLSPRAPAAAALNKSAWACKRRKRQQVVVLIVSFALVLWAGLTCVKTHAQPQSADRPLTIAVLDFADSNPGRTVSDLLAKRLAAPGITVVDRELSRAAARGTGYQGSLNMTVAEARDLGAAIGCDYYVVGDSQTLRRSPSSGPVYYEAYASVFLVSARTGRLISWERPSTEASTATAATAQLITQLGKDEVSNHYLRLLQKARDDERLQRQLALERNTPVIEEADGEGGETSGVRSPRPYRRLKPAYPDTAARADAGGTVDVLVELDKQGEVSHVDVARWAGFGMDEAALDTVRQLHFFPASRDGIAIPIRVLLRYNFRRPTQ